MLRALEKEGVEVVDGQQAMLDAREVKTADEIELLKMACAMVDATYVDIARAIRPGTRENELVAMIMIAPGEQLLGRHLRRVGLEIIAGHLVELAEAGGALNAVKIGQLLQTEKVEKADGADGAFLFRDGLCNGERRYRHRQKSEENDAL